ncbi:MAG: AAA family ATPase, partial [Dysgonamonadaceae bacterium]|nr:AAA family ATPase [Dysgonamonadaceae bacterium]
MALQKLPIGIQSFDNLREGNYLYIDKTEDIFRLIKMGQIYFLSRPRRFGKSMIISALDCLFSCKKHLFEGLYIYDKW